MAYINVNEPTLVGNEKKYLQECIDTGWISSEGPFVKKLESSFASTVSRAEGISVSSGTAALDVAVRALGIGPGDEVLVPSFTIISCAQAVVGTGATPVFVDCDPETWNTRPDQFEKAITPATKAIMAVHIYGLPTDMDPVLELARTHNLFVIEDAAQAIGLDYKGKPCGSFGDISCVSFFSNKFVTTGEGGMVLTDDPQLAERCRSLRNLCFQPGKRFVHEELGYNYRLCNLQAAVGLAQLERLETSIEDRRKVGRRYIELLEGTPGLYLPPLKTEYADNCFWMFGVVTKPECPLNAEELAKLLHERGIGSRPFFWPMHEQPVFRKMGIAGQESLPHAENLARRGLYIPTGSHLTDEQVVHVAEVLKDIMQGAQS